MHEPIFRLFALTYGGPPAQVIRLAADGSQRSYYRLIGAPAGPVIGAFGPDADENRAFLSFSRSFRGVGLPVPEIFAADERHGVWLEQDLGDTTLFQTLAAARERQGGGFPRELIEVYERVIVTLPRFQVEGGRVIDFGVAYPRPAFDRQSMLWDLNYFKYHFLKLAHVPFNEQRLENDFQRLIDVLLTADAEYFLYRDFQSRNVMLRDGEPWFIDYQGGRRGPAQYDVASLLYDAKADLPDDVRALLLDRYLSAFARLAGVRPERFLATYPGFAFIRIMQAMGAYGYRGFFERKPRFLESVPHAARNLAGLLAGGMPAALPELEAVLRRIVDEWAERQSPVALPGLTIFITSFSYRQGTPPDETGHGGGFIFDCRSLPNPGRFPEFAGLTGRDAPVIAYLEAAPEVEAFWSHLAPLVDQHLASFRQRGFTDLSVGFGCTGGQHRSVYFAERLARHVRARHPDVRVRLQHTEEANWARERSTAGEDPGTGDPGPPSAAGSAAAAGGARAAGPGGKRRWTR